MPTLSTGSRLGPYEIISPLGAGGMGEVFRAKDLKLGREVALKILPNQFASDPDRIARFQREAQVLAALNHPQIAAIYGVEEADDVRALVLELVEGETLADRIAREPIPVDEALPIAKQIAEALEAAHEQGIIHRDLKPANIKVNADGRVKVLDFGLAKLAEQPTSAASKPFSVSMSPTITTPAMTQMGMILGTAAYMSPEQAKGRPADKRSDVWAFGCLLYEMLTGRRAFLGADVTETIAAVVKDTPDWDRLPNDTPVAVRRLLRRCLAKEHRRRLADVSDARLELEEATTPDPVGPPQRNQRRILWLLLGAFAAGAVAIGVTIRPFGNSRPAAELTRFALVLPTSPNITLANQGRELAISPDGRTVAYAVRPTGIFLRRMDRTTFQFVEGTDSGTAPFFSPDGQWLAFVAAGSLKKTTIAGGLAVPIADTAGPVDGTWGDDDSIVIARDGDLYEVAANGGALQLLIRRDDDGPFARPAFLPGSAALFVRRPERDRIDVVERASRTSRPLVSAGTAQLTADGDLVFEQDGRIWAAAFDSTRFAILTTPVPLVDNVRAFRDGALFAVASNGTLSFVSSTGEDARTLVWIERSGKTSDAIATRAAFQSPRISPDGTQVAVSVGGDEAVDLWTYDLQQGRRRRLTTNGRNRRSVWSADGKQIAYYSTEEQGRSDQDLFLIPSTGGEPRRILARAGRQYPDAWSPDGRVIVFSEGDRRQPGRRDLWVLPLGGEAAPLHVTPFNERGAVFSPRDGRWLAFVSDESGRSEVYVQPFPATGTKYPVSVNGGMQPMWSRDARELYYREADWLMAVRIQLQPFLAAAPERLFPLPGNIYNLDSNFADYDVAPDGRFVAIRADTSASDQLEVVLNWTEEVRRALGRR